MAIIDYLEFSNDYLVKDGMLGNAVNINKPTDQLKIEIDELNINKIEKIVSVDNSIVRFDGINGAVQNSLVTINDSGLIDGSITGNAGTSTSLATARTVSLTGAITGSTSFDGSSNVSITTVNTADPVLTITGAVTGTTTFTNLGNGTLSATLSAFDTSKITTGILPVLRGGSGVSTSTGIGNNVLSVSPVLTTPNIGNATGSITGNAGTSTSLATARTINGVSFNGTSNIVIEDSKTIVEW